MWTCAFTVSVRSSLGPSVWLNIILTTYPLSLIIVYTYCVYLLVIRQLESATFEYTPRRVILNTWIDYTGVDFNEIVDWMSKLENNILKIENCCLYDFILLCIATKKRNKSLLSVLFVDACLLKPIQLPIFINKKQMLNILI